MEKGEECENVCKEFRFGTSSKLFIGRLTDYYIFLEEIEEVLSKFNPELVQDHKDPKNELYLEKTLYPEEFFIDVEQELDLDTNIILNNYNMTQFELNVAEEGLNLFDIAAKSHFWLENQLTGKNVRKSYGTTFPGQDHSIHGGTLLDEYKYEEKQLPEVFD